MVLPRHCLLEKRRWCQICIFFPWHHGVKPMPSMDKLLLRFRSWSHEGCVVSNAPNCVWQHWKEPGRGFGVGGGEGGSLIVWILKCYMYRWDFMGHLNHRQPKLALSMSHTSNMIWQWIRRIYIFYKISMEVVKSNRESLGCLCLNLARKVFFSLFLIIILSRAGLIH